MMPPDKKEYCMVCKNWKPERAHHCSMCERCVLKMDHHCPWLGNCVGYHNYKQFFLFTLYQAVSSIHFICNFRSLASYIPSRYIPSLLQDQMKTLMTSH